MIQYLIPDFMDLLPIFKKFISTNLTNCKTSDSNKNKLNIYKNEKVNCSPVSTCLHSIVTSSRRTSGRS